MRIFGLGFDYSVDNLMQKYKKMATEAPGSLSTLNGPCLILLKENSKEKSVRSLSPTQDKIYDELIAGSAWEEESQTVTLQLSNYNSMKHKKFFNAVQSVLKIKGTRELNSKFECKSNPVKFPFARGKREFPSVRIIGESKSIDMFQLSVVGESSVIIAAFFLKSILKCFLRSIKGMHSNLLMGSDFSNTDKDENEGFHQKVEMPLNNKKVLEKESVTIEDASDDDEITFRNYFDIPKENIKERLLNSTPNKRDIGCLDAETSNNRNKKFQKVDDYFNTSKDVTIEDATVEALEKVEVNDLTETDIEPEDVCYLCALLDIATNSDDLLQAEPIQYDLECKSDCMDPVNCFEKIVRSITALVSGQIISEIQNDILKRNIQLMFDNILDHTSYSRPDFYCQVLELLEEVPDANKHRIIVMLRELCEDFIGEEIQLFQETLKRKRSARRNLLKFMTSTGKVFSLQSLLESLNIMQKKGIDLKCLFPSYLYYIFDMFANAPEVTSTEYFFYMAKITRTLMTGVLKEKNIMFIKARRIEFRIGLNVIQKPWDQHIYFNKIENVIYHFLCKDKYIICEEIEFCKLKCDAGLKQISTGILYYIMRRISYWQVGVYSLDHQGLRKVQ